MLCSVDPMRLIAADGHGPCCSAPRVTSGMCTGCADIWRSDGYRRLREAMRDGTRLPHCAGCDVFLAENQALHQIYLGERLGIDTKTIWAVRDKRRGSTPGRTN